VKLEWMPLALKDRIEAFHYIAKDSLQNAIAVDDAIEAQCDQLIDFPESARAASSAPANWSLRVILSSLSIGFPKTWCIFYGS